MVVHVSAMRNGEVSSIFVRFARTPAARTPCMWYMDKCVSGFDTGFMISMIDMSYAPVFPML